MRHRDITKSSSDYSSTIHHLEYLEPRLLLTTVMGGETFQFTDVNNQLVQVHISGDAIVELIGANADGSNVTLGDLPGLFAASNAGRSGTTYLLDGSSLVGQTTIRDLLYALGDADPGDEINLQALASESALYGGGTYAFNVAEVNGNQVVQVVHLNNDNGAGTVSTMLDHAALGIDTGAALSTVLGSSPDAMAFDPVTRQIFAVTNSAADNGHAHLWSISRQTGVVTDLGIITNQTTTNPLSGVRAIGFDTTGELFALTHDFDGNPNSNATFGTLGDDTTLDGAMVHLHYDPLLHTATFDGVIGSDVTLLNDNITGSTTFATDPDETYTAMTLELDANGDPSSGYWLAVSSATASDGTVSSQLERIDPGSGNIIRRNAIKVDQDVTEVDGIAYATDANGNWILVGLDNGRTEDVNGVSVVRSRLIKIVAGTGAATALSLADGNATVGLFAANGQLVASGTPAFRDLVSVNETGDLNKNDFTLWTSTGTQLKRGSATVLGLNADGTTQVVSVTAADFRPSTGSASDGLLYFVVDSMRDVAGTPTLVHEMYTLDVNAVTRSAVQSSLTRIGTIGSVNNPVVSINSIAWDQTAAGTTRMLLSVVAPVNGVDQGRIFAWDGTTVAGNGTLTTTAVCTVTLVGSPVTNITGIELVNDNIAAPEGFIFATINGAAATDPNTLVRINLTTGVATPMGSTTDIDDTSAAPIRGEDLQGLSWNPSVTNPFTGEIGALMATDASTDDLVILDTRFRSADQLFSIYVSQASAGASITVSTYNITPGGASLTPYTGVSPLDEQGHNTIVVTTDARYDLQVTNAQSGQNLIVTFDAGIGGVYIGAKQWVERAPNARPLEPLRPIISSSLATQLGVYAASDGTVDAGIVVDDNLLQYFVNNGTLDARMLGGNLDQIVSLAIRRDLNTPDAIVVIDNDRVDEAGVPTGAELGVINPATGRAYVDPNTGQVTSVFSIIDSGTGLPIMTIDAAAWGDLDFDGNEILHAIAEINDPAPQDPSGFGLDGDLLGNYDFVALTAGPTGILYGINNNGGTLELVSITRTVAGDISAVSTGLRLMVLNTNATTSSDPAYVPMTNVYGMDIDPLTGEVYLIGENAAGNVALFTLDLTAVDLTDDNIVNVVDILANEVAGLTPANPIVDMAFLPVDIRNAAGVIIHSKGTLYAVENSGGASTLVTINRTTGAIANVAGGAIQIGAVTDLDIAGIDFNNDGLLLAVDGQVGSLTRRVVRINIDNPADSSQYTNPGTVSDTLQGYTADNAGLFYGVGNTGGNELLFVSAGLSPVLGTIDTTNGVFTTTAALDARLQAVGVRSMAFAPFVSEHTADRLITPQRALYVIGNDNAIYEVSARGSDVGQVVFGGDPIVDIHNNPLQVNSLVFNRDVNSAFTSGLVLAIDTVNGRLVDLDLTGMTALGTGTVVAGTDVATADGSIRPTVGGLAYDFTNNRFVAADNATSQMNLATREATAAESATLMVLKGITGISTAAEVNAASTSQDIGNILIGGKVTGRVDLSGSIDIFYAGSILTGQTDGQSEGSALIPGNFHVAGDIRNLVSGSSLGTNSAIAGILPTYVTGFDLTVGGQVSTIWALNSFLGTFDIQNNLAVPGSNIAIRELEGRAITDNAIEDEWLGNQLDGPFLPRLYDGTVKYYNDTFDTAQAVGTLRNPVAGAAAYSRISGILDTTEPAQDVLDFYSISLMAGQIIEIQLDPLYTFSSLGLGVFDPDGRLIATNFNKVNASVTTFEPFQFVADRPGEYRIAIGTSLDRTFEGNVTVLSGFSTPYVININNVGEMALGGLHVTNNILTVAAATPSFHVDRGDLGAIAAGGSLWFDTGSIAGFTAADILVDDGNLRALVAGVDIGMGGTLIVATPFIEVHGGGIGLIRNSGAVMFFDTGDITTGDPDNAAAFVDGDIQMIDAAGVFGGYVFTNQGIGVIRAGEMTVLGGYDLTYFHANADNLGNDGIIDLVDVAGNLGTLGGGGPGFKTGPGGDVRYMRVGGTIWQDQQFQIGDYTPFTANPGVAYEHVDDSGGKTLITPGMGLNPAYDPTLPPSSTNPKYLSGSLTYTQYNIRGSGGSVLINLVSSAYGVTFESKSIGGVHAPVEVSRVEVQGSGQAVIVDPRTGRLVLDTLGDDVSVRFSGSLPIDVLDIVGTQISSIVNTSGGEIVSITADSVGTIDTSGRLGLPSSSTGTLVNPIAVINDVYPFSLQSTGINITGDVVNIFADRGLGNLMIGGSVDTIEANENRRNDSGSVEGVLAPIYVAGELFYINVGEVMAPAGSGSFSHAGLYVEGAIGTVTNQSGGNIYGDIISNTSIGTVKLSNGSLINTQVATYGDLDMAAATTAGATLMDTVGIIEIGQIELTGNGGIIGSLIWAGDIGDITVKGGFGIFGSSILNISNNTVGNITVDGFGILGTEIQGGATVGNITATGKGNPLSISSYAQAIRYNATGLDYDPYFHFRLTELNDVGLAFANNFNFQYVAGQITDVDAHGTISLGDVKAYRIVNTTLNFGTSIRSITTLKSVDLDPTTIDGLQVTTGYLKSFKPGADVSGLNLTVAGEIGSINLKGNLLGGSSINAVGPNGYIKGVTISGNLEGSLYANGSIGNIKVGGDMTGDITADGQGVTRGYTINGLQVGGDFLGSFTATYGDVGKMQVTGSFGQTGLPGDMLYIGGSLKSLSIGNARSAAISYLAADVIVLGDLGTIDVIGQIGGSDPLDTDGAIFVGGNLGALKVRAHSTNIGDSLVNGDVIVGGELGLVDIRDGNLGDGVNPLAITTTGLIKKVQLTNGDLADGFTIESLTGDISSFAIKNGDLNGNLIADSGAIGKVDVVGSDLAGAISALSAGDIKFDGSIASTGSIVIIGDVRNLQVGVDIMAGADIDLGSLQQLKVGNDLLSDLNIGYNTKGTKVYVGNDWVVANNTSIDALVQIDVRGDLLKTAGGVLQLGDSVKQLSVAGQSVVDIIIAGSADRIDFTSLEDSVITIAHDVRQFTVKNAMTNSLVQVGISAGDDGVFAAVGGQEDAHETTRMADIQTFTVGSMTDSILAVGGSINRLTSGAMTRSSASSGLVLGSHAIRAVLDDTTRLADTTEQNNARTGDDRALYRGDITTALIKDAGMIDSYLTAGVDAGATGDFSTPDVLSSKTGGTSKIGTVTGILGLGSRLVSDAPIVRHRTTDVGGTINEAVTYDPIADFGVVSPNLGAAVNGAPLTLNINGHIVTITVQGNGQVALYDAGGDDTIDAIVLTGTDDRTKIAITGGGVLDIARILTGDDATVRELTFDGNIVGDGLSATTDLWIDGAVRLLRFNDMGSDFTGQIGGDIDTLTMADQGAGRLRIGGYIKNLTIASDAVSPLQNVLGAYASQTYTTMSYDSSGNLWAFNTNTGRLELVNPAIDNSVGSSVNVTDNYSGQSLVLLGLDFLGAGADPYAIARMYDPQPTQAIGLINSGVGTDLRGLAVNSAGQIYAVDSTTGLDRLVRIDPVTGQQTVIGELRNPLGNSSYTQNILAMTFDNSGRLIALVSDRDGNGIFDDNQVALVQIDTTASAGFNLVHMIGNVSQKGVLLGGGGVTDAFTGLAVASNNTIYAIRRTGGTTDTLVTINPATGAVLTAVNVQINGGGAGVTNIRDIGFDQDGNLVAYDTDGTDGRLIYLSNLADASTFAELTEGNSLVNPDLDGFAFGRSGTNFRTYAYDTTGDGTFYSNPVDASDASGRVLVLGTLNTVSGDFTRLVTLSDPSSAPLLIPSAQTSIAMSADATTNTILFVTPATGGGSQLVSFDADPLSLTYGQFSIVGNLVDSLNRNVSIGAMDFDTVSGELIGLDTTNELIVTIDPLTAEVTVRTNAGVISPDLTDLTYDPISGSFYSYQAGDADTFIQLKGTTDDAAGALIATGIDRLSIGSPYYGRIITTGNTFKSVTLNGDFYGTLTTAGNIDQLTQKTGVFAGTLDVVGDIGRVQFYDDVLAQANITAGRQIKQLDQKSGTFAGYLSALFVGKLNLSGSVLSTASFSAASIDQFDVRGDFAGTTAFTNLNKSFQVYGLLDTEGLIQIENFAKLIRIRGGTAAGSRINVGGNLDTLSIGLTHSGQIVVNGNLNKADFGDVNQGTLFVGGNSSLLKVNGTSTDALFAYGITLGADGIYNTADDVIVGGSLSSAQFRGDYIDSILTAGVLPGLAAGPGIPADHQAFLRVAGTAGTLVTNATEAGGLRRSSINKLSFNAVIHTVPSDPTTQPLVATANGVGQLTVRSGGYLLAVQTLSDPIGAPTVLSVTNPASNQIRITFSEPINTDSLRLSLTDGDDGTVIVKQNDVIVTGLTMAYTEQTLPNGDVQGVLTITRSIGFDTVLPIVLTLVGTGANPIVDASGLRSMLRQVGDPLGTIFDGNGDGVEGGDYGRVTSSVDAADDFDLASVPVHLVLDSSVVIGDTFADDFDVDVSQFTGIAGQYFAVSYHGIWDATLGVFQLDNQGTPETTDDTYELLARYESTLDGDSSIFQAFELPDTGTYYVVVTPDSYGDLSDVDSSYTLTLSLAASDAALASVVGGSLISNRIDFGGGDVQDIAYVSNANRVSKQLVYLNFDGGVSDLTSEGTVNVDALDAADLDPILAGLTSQLINGGGGVTGILDNILRIFDFTSSIYPVGFAAGIGSVDVQMLGNDLTNYLSAATGLFFTTVDPAVSSGLDPTTDFTTIFIGQTDDPYSGLLGLASDIDVAGQNPADQAIVFAENFAGAAGLSTPINLLNQYSRYLANTISHELLHTLGMNHQPTSFYDYLLDVDDPNNDGVVTDSNGGAYAIMSYAPTDVDLAQLGELGTASLTYNEFPIGSIDVATLFVRWFS